MGLCKKISVTLLALQLVLAFGITKAQPKAPAQKVLRYALAAAETGFDPIQVNDVYSRLVLMHVFDGPLTYDYLASPAKLKPNVAEALPVASNNFKTWTFKIRPGIYFADDPAFKGKKRELTAQDFVYTYKRIYDPVWRSAVLGDIGGARILGLAELRQAAQKPGAKFDYDREVAGIRALDRYTLQFNLGVSQPRFDVDTLVSGSQFGAVAREVVEFYGDRISEHPVGTGPFQLKEWRRSSKNCIGTQP
jgi:ABC-type transport system substrate-binding protein